MISSNLQTASGSSSPIILVVNKIDCAPFASELVDACGFSFNKKIFTCAVTGQGIQDLEAAIVEIVGLNKIPAGGRKWTVNQVSCLKEKLVCFCNLISQFTILHIFHNLLCS